MGTSTLQFPFILLTLRGSGNHILLESQLLWITTHRAGGFWLNCWVRTATDSLISAAWQRICSSAPLAWHRWDFLRDPLLLWVGNSPSCELGFGFWKSQVLRCGSVSWDQQGKESWELRMDALFEELGQLFYPWCIWNGSILQFPGRGIHLNCWSENCHWFLQPDRGSFTLGKIAMVLQAVELTLTCCMWYPSGYNGFSAVPPPPLMPPRGLGAVLEAEPSPLLCLGYTAQLQRFHASLVCVRECTYIYIPSWGTLKTIHSETRCPCLSWHLVKYQPSRKR